MDQLTLATEMMSSAAEEEADKNVCANCGIAGVDNIKLKICDGGCDRVKYCSEKCREEHREQHSEECEKRAAKLHDKRLFTQPDSCCYGECPICFLPMPLEGKSTFMACCGQLICRGCGFSHIMSNKCDREAITCAFCRTSASDTKEYTKKKMERIEANDPAALCYMGYECYQAGDYDKAVEYWTKAAELGNYAEAQFRLGYMYGEGVGAEKDGDKALYYWEKAAIGGHPIARHNLGSQEERNGNVERAVKHWIIAANLGYDKSMKALLPSCKAGHITKEEYGATLRTHQAAIDATKSSQREVAYATLAKLEQKRKIASV